MDNKTENKIPKIIHYCWFGGKPLPNELQECVDSWKKLKGYTVMRWDESNCSFDENDFVRKTYADKQLGFIGDYYRLKAVYEYGGIYLDTDVKVNRSFDKLLSHRAFINFIFDCHVGTAIIGSEKENPLIGGLLELYDKTEIIMDEAKDGRLIEPVGDKFLAHGYVTSNYFFTYYILNHYPNFILNNRFQDLGDFVIYPKELFEIGTLSGRHFAVHYCAGEWRIKEDDSKTMKAKIKRLLKKCPFLFDKVQVIVRKRRYYNFKICLPFYSYYLAQRNGTELPKI